MGKILHWKIKYNYVMRYRQGESPTKLGREINPNLKNPLENILIWNKKYENEGIIGLVPKNKKKKKIDYEKWTKEDLINLEKLRDDFEKWTKEHHHNHCRAFLYEYIENCKFKLSKKKICLCLGVAESSFYKWKKQGLRNKYDPVLLFRITLLFFKFKKVFGFRRITNYLFRIYGIKIIYWPSKSGVNNHHFERLELWVKYYIEKSNIIMSWDIVKGSLRQNWEEK